MKKIKLLSLFSGVGAFEKALERLGVEYDLVNYCEVDKYASKAYALIHNCSEEKNLGDITKVDACSLPHDIDLITYGFPCQDISLAGKQKGFTDSDGNKTRSGLFFDALRIIDETKPKVAIAENVKNLVSKKFKNEFEIVLNSLDQAGYNSYYKVLNAKDYGIPQNRERVFIVSIRKDIDPFNIMFSFPFPEKEELKLRLKDMLEDEVDEKYYLSDAMIRYIVANNDKWTGNNRQSLVNKSVASTITTGEGSKRCDASNYISEDLQDDCDLKDYKDPKCVQIGNLKGGKWDKINESCRRVYSGEGLSPTIHTCQGGNTEPKIGIQDDVEVDLKRGYSVKVKEEKENSESIDVIGNYSKSEFNQTPIVGKNGIAPTVTENHGQVTAIAIKNKTKQGYLLAEEGDGVDVSGRMQYHRGTVQKGVSQTLSTAGGNNVGVVIGSTQKNAYVGTTDGISPTLTEAMGKGGGQVPMITDLKVTRLGGIFDKENEKHQAGSTYDKEGLSPTIDTGVGGYRQPLIATSLWTETQAKMITPDGNIKRYIGSDVVDEFKEGQAADISFPNGYNKGPRVHDECPALNITTTKNSFIVKSLRIRKLTPKECWRLMGFDDKDVDILVNSGMSNTQLYKQAGNSIVVDVLVKIFSNLFKSDIIK